MKTTKRLMHLAPLAMALIMGGCETLTVPDYNNPGIDEIQANPNRTTINTQATGLLIGARNGISGTGGYVSATGIIGRESYNFDASDPRFATELLRDALNGGNGAFGGNHWVNRYANIRNATSLLDAVDMAEAEDGVFSAAEIAAIRGFAKTIKALDFLMVVNTRDDFGAPIDVGGPPTGEPAPIVAKTEVFAEISSLLDEGDAHLQNAGTEFSFPISDGFAGFDTPDTFREFNRALAARVAVYTGDYAAALTALAASFIDDDPAIDLADLSHGVYHVYSEGPGDLQNGLYDPSHLILLAHPSIVTDAQAGDERLDRKVVQVPEVDDQASLGITSDRAFTIYGGTGAPVSIIRNEELILLRAEANLGLDNVDEARADINLIRQQSGGLPPISPAAWSALTAEQRLDELLYNKRYSLLYEGHRWIDMRRYDKLDELPLDVAGLVVHRQYPFPIRECDARTPPPSRGC